MKKYLITIFMLILLSAGAYYYFYIYEKQGSEPVTTNTNTNPGFTPLNRPPLNTNTSTSTTTTTDDEIPTQKPVVELPALRQISTTPVAGMSASSTASSSVVRYMDRGTGHVYEAKSDTDEIVKISNTTLPKIYESFWNKNLNAFVLRYLKDDGETITNFYGELRSMGTSTTATPYEIKGRYISESIDNMAVSPTGDKIFTWNIENGRGIGYISSFDEKNKVKVVDSPITKASVAWPEVGTVTLLTKPSATGSGFMYRVDTKTGVMKKIVGGIRGLSGKMSRDLSKTLISGSTGNIILTSLVDSKDGSMEEVIFRTLADKCVWSSKYKNEVYCAVPTEIPSGFYPDSWYRGEVQFIDQIWHLDTTTGEVHLLANLLRISNKLIDAVDLTLDPREDFLYFINKRDLTLWSLDLNR